jgi:His/Glu/Gln/Arg/opine family amino acid ABC transporter permease subunit
VNYNWNWGIFFQTSPDGVHTYLETLLLGTGWTLATALSAWCLALAMGTLVGVIRTTPNPWLVRLGTAYVELFRNVPLLVQMFLWYFVLPELLPTQAGDWLKQLPDASFYTAVVALGFYTSARVAEQVRAAKYFDGRFYRHNRRAGLWFHLMTWSTSAVAVCCCRNHANKDRATHQSRRATAAASARSDDDLACPTSSRRRFSNARRLLAPSGEWGEDDVLADRCAPRRMMTHCIFFRSAIW